MTDRELMQQALEAMGTVGADHICQASHHAKKDQHQWGEICPLQQRWHIAFQALRERLAQPEQEPFCYHDGRNIVGKEFADHSDVFPLYTTPPMRQWQGLTADEIWQCNIAPKGSAVEYHICMAHQNVLDFAEAIEAKLKEKNA